MTAAMIPPSSSAGPRLPVLDGVRGLAILMICFYHFYAGSGFVVAQSKLALDRGFSRIADTGWMGVDLFFVLSGFLITGILLDAKSGNGFFRNFYARRFLRIFPPYYGFLFFLIIVLPVFLRNNADLDLLRDHQAWYWTYTFNIFVPLNPGVDLGFYGNGHLWSLAIEEQFYLVWPLVVMLVSRRSLIGVCCACIICAFVIRLGLVNGAVDRLDNIFSAPMLLPARIDSLAFGALLAAVAAGPGGLGFLRQLAAPVAAAAAVGLVLLFLVRDGLSLFDPWVQIGGFTLVALLCAGMLLALLTLPAAHILPRALSLPYLRFFGKYSYAMYIFHFQVALIMVRRFSERADWPLVFGSAIPMRIAFTLLGIAIVTLLAWGSWHLFERHFLKLKRYFEYTRPIDLTGQEAKAQPPAPATTAVSSAQGGS